MKYYLSFIALFFILQVSLFAQNTSISGVVIDKVAQTPVEQATVRFLSEKDSSYVNGTATNAEGKFNISLKQGRYITHISFIGYTDSYVNVNATGTRKNIGTIELNEDGVLLSEAVVTAKVVEIAIKGDTVEYNADSYKVQESAVVEDLLKKMPGAEVDTDGKITINGKEIKKILVDGEEFFSNDPKVASKNLPAAMVDKLQVLDRKSDMARMTGFDDDEEETVINLTVKKGMKQGLFGSATLGGGNHDRYGMSGIANYMLDKNQITVLGGTNNTNNEGFTDDAAGTFRGMRGGNMNFGSGSGITKSINGGVNLAFNPSSVLKWGGNIRYGNNKNNLETNRYTQNYQIKDKRGDQFETRDSWGINRTENIRADLRMEWTPDTLTRIIFSPRVTYGKNKNIQSENFTTTYEDPNDIINEGSSSYFSDGENKEVSGRLEVSRQLGKKGRVLSFSLSGEMNDLNNDGTNWSNTQFFSVLTGQDSTSIVQDQQFNQKNKGYNWRGYVSYVEPIGRNNFVQLNYSYRKSYSESDKHTLKNDGFGNYDIIDTTATKKLENDFINQEIGLNFKSVREKFNYTIGVALQPSRSESWTISPERRSRVSNDVLNFAPVAQFNYMWDKRHNLRVNYNGRTNQPSTSQLSDVRDDSDPLNIVYGNPNLKPGFSNRFRARYQKFNPEQASAFMVFGGFNFSTNDIVSKVMNMGGGKKETTYENINGNWDSNLRIMMNRPLRNKKFSINTMTYANISQSNGFIDADKNKATNLSLSENLGLQFRSDLMDFGLRGNYTYSNTQNSLQDQQDRTIHRYGGNFSSTIYLPYDFTIDTDINYSATSGSTEGYDLNEWLWNASIAKQIFKAKNGTLRFKFYDILQQRSNISQSATSQRFMETRTNTINSYFMFSFQYKFQIFKGGAKQADMNGFDRGGFRGGPGFQGGPPPM